MTSELSEQQNDAITYFTCGSISRHSKLFFQSSQELFPPLAASLFVKFKRNLYGALSRYFGMKLLLLEVR